MTTQVDGNDLILYLDDKRISVLTGCSFEVTPTEELPVLAPAREYQFTASKFEFPELTYMQKLEMEWRHTVSLPRKAKKVRRILIKKAVIAERYRQRVSDYLSTI